MIALSRRMVLGSSMALAACSLGPGRGSSQADLFECPPCGCSADGDTFAAPGHCPACGMTLRPAKDWDLGFEPDLLPKGAGHFELPGPQSASVQVHYFRPASFHASSPILLVLPGAGRNSAEYRNAWLETAQSHGVLIASLGYPQDGYDFAAYNMGGIVRNFRFKNPEFERPSPRATIVRLLDENIRFDVNPNRDEWLFGHLDRVFEFVAKASGSTARRYDIFGHSAGAQILHRMAMFSPGSKAHRLVAANAGFYTLPDLELPLLTGLAGSGIDRDGLQAALRERLVVMLGGEDDSETAGGTFLRTPLVDAQGPGRMQRGMNFFRKAEALAKAEGIDLAWQLVKVPEVGHDFEGMASAAATHLYGP